MPDKMQQLVTHVWTNCCPASFLQNATHVGHAGEGLGIFISILLAAGVLGGKVSRECNWEIIRILSFSGSESYQIVT